MQPAGRIGNQDAMRDEPTSQRLRTLREHDNITAHRSLNLRFMLSPVDDLSLIFIDYLNIQADVQGLLK